MTTTEMRRLKTQLRRRLKMAQVPLELWNSQVWWLEKTGHEHILNWFSFMAGEYFGDFLVADKAEMKL